MCVQKVVVCTQDFKMGENNNERKRDIFVVQSSCMGKQQKANTYPHIHSPTHTHTNTHSRAAPEAKFQQKSKKEEENHRDEECVPCKIYAPERFPTHSEHFSMYTAPVCVCCGSRYIEPFLIVVDTRFVCGVYGV